MAERYSIFWKLLLQLIQGPRLPKKLKTEVGLLLYVELWGSGFGNLRNGCPAVPGRSLDIHSTRTGREHRGDAGVALRFFRTTLVAAFGFRPCRSVPADGAVPRSPCGQYVERHPVDGGEHASRKLIAEVVRIGDLARLRVKEFAGGATGCTSSRQTWI